MPTVAHLDAKLDVALQLRFTARATRSNALLLKSRTDNFKVSAVSAGITEETASMRIADESAQLRVRNIAGFQELHVDEDAAEHDDVVALARPPDLLVA